MGDGSTLFYGLKKPAATTFFHYLFIESHQVFHTHRLFYPTDTDDCFHSSD